MRTNQASKSPTENLVKKKKLKCTDKISFMLIPFTIRRASSCVNRQLGGVLIVSRTMGTLNSYPIDDNAKGKPDKMRQSRWFGLTACSENQTGISNSPLLP